MRLLDTFSGIGGFSYALSNVCKTVAYCDIAQSSRDVLSSLMKRGKIHKALVFQDIKDISRDDLIKLKPEILTAGFPCTDISSANPDGAGLKGRRSGLFKEVLRLLDSSPSIRFVFLENSPRIKFKGLKEIKKSLVHRGFVVRYTYIEALDVGALHKRKRWYCLAYKQDVTHAERKKLMIPDAKNASPWNVEYSKHQRVVGFKTKKERDSLRARCGLLGNSVVPQCVRAAWNALLMQELEYAKFKGAHRTKPLNLEFRDGCHKASVYYRKYWATPVHTTWHNYSRMTYRGIGLLSNQAFYEVGTQIHTREHKPRCAFYKEFTCNPEFIEYLMGYPRDWTRS